MEERLQKIISSAGIMSRRSAEEAILAGRVTVNGSTATLGMKANPDVDEIAVDNEVVSKPSGYCYIMLYKPKGYVTTLSDEKSRKCVADLLSGTGTRLYPVGRLDLNSEGLLLMTNDGNFANLLMHPSGEIKKTYRTHVIGTNPASAADKLSEPMIIDGYKIRPAYVKLVKDYGKEAVFDITIHEGRNRQVRKMCELCGLTVKKLCRIQEGSLTLGNLKPGQWRFLTENEVHDLMAVHGADE